ncbi:MAG: GtrA family protein [Enterococcus sp.]|nr:GtrA family protein [Enterococcus sp.]
MKTLNQQKQLKEIRLYLIFGVLTTVVNFLVFYVTKDLLALNLVVSNTISWLLSVVFAFITNKKWVFGSNDKRWQTTLQELFKFIFYRLLSFGLDMGSLIVMIDYLKFGDYFAKLISQFFVIVANFLFSKWLVFKKRKE